MVVLNATFALLSAFGSSQNSSGCTNNEIYILTHHAPSESALNTFNCLLDWGTPSAVHCQASVFSAVSAPCSTCTYSQMSSAVLLCFANCSVDDSSDFCQKCVATFLSTWTSACAPRMRTSLSSSSSLLCDKDTLVPRKDVIATQLSTCLAVNQTRAIDCMTNNGFANIPNDCGSCLFGSQFITDSICNQLCAYRPFSGMCMTCINAYVANSIRNCFLLNDYSMTPTAPCTSSDLDLIGPSGHNVDIILSECIDSVSCMASRSGYLIPGKGVVSNSCIQCINVGETRTGFSCVQNACGNITTDCAYSPSIGSFDALCSKEDLSAFDDRSSLKKSINECLFSAPNRTMETITSCLDSVDYTPFNRTITGNCRSCMSGVLANMTSCVPTCNTYGNETTACQECIGTSMAYSFSACFGEAQAGVCSLAESTTIAYESWSLGILQRCLLDNLFDNIPSCLNKAGLGSSNALIDMSFECQNCLSQYLLHNTDCPTFCRNNGSDSNECRLCVTDSLTKMLQNCTINGTIGGSFNNSRNASVSSLMFALLIIAFLISIL